MKGRCTHAVLIAGSLCVLWLAFLLAFPRAGTRVTGPLLQPWVAVCRALTPSAWQTRGNLLLGLMWVLSGVAVYSIIAGIMATSFLVLMNRICRPNKELKATR